MKELESDKFTLPYYIVKQIDFTKNTRLHAKVQNKPNEWRIGQAYFNYAYELYPNETDELRGTEYDCFYDNHKIPEFLEKLNEKLLEFDDCTIISGNCHHMNNMEFEGEHFMVNGKCDDKFANDRIRELREKRNNLQDKINGLSKQLTILENERDNTQKEIDQEFLKQEHAYDLVGKYIQFNGDVYHVKNVERLFQGVRLVCDMHISREKWMNINGNGRYIYISITFNDLEELLNSKDDNCMFSEEEVKELILKTLFN